jgi:hexosaminidase
LLQQKGAIDGRFYSQDQVRALIAYARDRGVRIVPEFEMPGHLKSWLIGYPELASGPGPYHLGSDYAGGDAALNPADEHVYQFLDRFIGEMSALFPDHYFHIGGDEVLGQQWAANPGIQQFMKAHSLSGKGELQAYFTRRVNDLVRAHGKIMIGWDEVLDGHAPESVTVEAWRSSRMTAVSVKAGHATIVATPYYLDLLAPAGRHYSNDPLDTNAWGVAEKDYQAADKEGGLLTNGFALQGEIPLTARQQSLVMGGEAEMWTETITPEMLDAGLWPRSAAIAERFWSARNVTDVADMYQRLYSVDRLLAVLGTNQYANQQRMLFRMAPRVRCRLKRSRRWLSRSGFSPIGTICAGTGSRIKTRSPMPPCRRAYKPGNSAIGFTPGSAAGKTKPLGSASLSSYNSGRPTTAGWSRASPSCPIGRRCENSPEIYAIFRP